MIKALFSRYILLTLLVIAAMAVMARLGVWQLERREQRIARNADLAAKLEAAPMSLNEAALAAQWPLPEDRTAVRNLPAAATGEYDFGNQLLLVQQNYREMPGAHLVVPLVLEGGSQAVLVDRGWVPFDDVQSGRWREYDDQRGLVTISGRVQPSQILFGQAGEQAQTEVTAAQPETEWYRIDLEAIQGQLPYQLLPVYLLEAPGADGNAALPYRIEPEVDLSEGPHMGYALQWFAIAIVAGVVYLAAVRSRLRKAHSAEEQADGVQPADAGAALTGDAATTRARA
jgi:surfeit locus 1 family protein